MFAFLTYNKLKQAKWQRLSPIKRLKVFQKIDLTIENINNFLETFNVKIHNYKVYFDNFIKTDDENKFLPSYS